MNKYNQDLKIGDRVVIFSYWNTRPEHSGIVVALSEHFAEVEIGRTLWTDKPITIWASKAERIEKVQDKP